MEASASPNPSSETATRETGHWCHQCNLAIVAEPAQGDDLICPECGGGFVEAMDTATTLSVVRRAARRQRRRQQRSPALRLRQRRADDVDVQEDMEDASPQQVFRFLQFLARNFGNAPPSFLSRLSDSLTRDVTHGPDDSDELDLTRETRNLEASDPYITPIRRESESVQADGDQVEHENNANTVDERTNEIGGIPGVNSGTGEADEDGNGDGDGEGDEEDVEEDDEEESDSDLEAGILDIGEWEESFDEDGDDEWEEVGDADLVVRLLEAVDGGVDGDGDVTREEREQDDATVHISQGEEADSTNVVRTNPAHIINVLPRSLRRRLQLIRRSLENDDTDIQLETPDFDTYFGNPGDYVDARGFEELLQQLLDTDNTRRGAPPASQSAIERLITVKIQQENLENGSALCAICKDVVALGEPAKQLPCLHLYHSLCIVPWLSARNSCPVCRYELPTDDPDYEEQRKSKSSCQVIGNVINTTTASSTSNESGGVVAGSDGRTDEGTPSDLGELQLDKVNECDGSHAGTVPRQAHERLQPPEAAKDETE
ncbi:hypothetical protein KP509_34G007400 [Ceratopteris richardii]|uniref:RING-type E3 ubiquitin transferase n=1 Tax=Ceratopteris richardii TaxID=49495 RepID=A0A8T2QIM2_CERRI|nr:hypothetical protein KP509_34G007400 [Ceratopteris richardii]